MVNVFTEKSKRRGRPAGPTPQAALTRARLYALALESISTRGYAATTLRDIAAAAGVSVGLLYRYFPSKEAIVLALYDDLSQTFAAHPLPAGRWRHRFSAALAASLATLAPHRLALAALTPILVGDPAHSLFSAATAFSRLRVQGVFELAVTGASDAPPAPLAAALGRLLYLLHLGVLLWWLNDRTPAQRATAALLPLLDQSLPLAALTLRLPAARRTLLAVDSLAAEALFAPHA